MNELIVIPTSEIRQLLREELANLFIQHQQDNPAPNQKEILNFKEGCEYLGISKSHGYKLTSAGKVPFSKKGKFIYFDKTELKEWILSAKVKGVAELEKEANQYLQKKEVKHGK